jgi:hypothetical protein
MRLTIRVVRFPRIMLALAVAGLILLPASAAAEPRPAASCENIKATVQGVLEPIFDDDFNLVGFALNTESLGGTVTGETFIERITPGGTIHFSGILVFENTDYGDFVTTDDGTTAPNGRVNTTLRLIEGGSGFISSHGWVDFTTLEFEFRQHGRICN